jgi:hypothetical protein
MAVRIRSLLVSGPIMVPLTTGRNVRLSPGESSAELHDVEVADNAKVDKLRRQGVIEVETTTSDESAGSDADAAGEGTGAESRPRSRKRPDSAG